MQADGLPNTFVPGRNLLFLSFAATLAYRRGASVLVGGLCETDYSGYPDCRPDYLAAMQSVFQLGTRQGREGQPIEIVAPLVELRKTDIIELGNRLGVPWAETWSCYAGGDRSCGRCDSCRLRLAAFAELGLTDPVPYEAHG